MTKIDKTTKVKHRFGNYELRLSDAKVEIEEIVNRTSKRVYSNVSYEYGLISYFIREDAIQSLEMLVYMLAYTNLIFSNEEFRGKYWQLIEEFVKKAVPSDSPDDEKIIDEMKKEREAKDLDETVLPEI